MGYGPLLTRLLQKLRVEETHRMAKFRWNIVWQNAVQNVPWAFAPALTFVAKMAITGSSSSLDTTKVFTSLSIVTLLTDPAAKLLSAIPSTAASLGCLDRVQKFLAASSRFEYRKGHTSSSRDHVVQHVGKKHVSLELSEVTKKSQTGNTANDHSLIQFHEVDSRPVGATTAILHSINFTIGRGSITMIIGEVASGKSTLLKTILGEAVVDRGSVTVVDPFIAYCSQEAWLPNTTIKKAICGHMEKEIVIDEAFYQIVKRTCVLDEDISLLAPGDETCIGSGSTMLSGGQKQRVALARALYARAPTLLLDDFVSALDARTKNIVVERLLGAHGLCRRLRTTVVLASHACKSLI